MLPKLPNRDQIKKAQTISFSGINRQPNAPDGTIYHTTNMDSVRMPCLAPRKKRTIIQSSFESHQGILAYDGLIWIESGYVFHNGKIVCNGLSVGQKRLAAMNDWLIVFPDKEIFYLKDIDTEPTTITETFHLTADFRDGTLNGERAEKNTIRSETFQFSNTDLRTGMTITLDGWAPGDYVIREVGTRELRFSENSFEALGTNKTITITRTVTQENPNKGFITRKPLDMEVSANVEFEGGFILTTEVDWRELPLEVGDGITITGAVNPENNRDLVIRGIDAVRKDGHDIYRLQVDEVLTDAVGQDITVSRKSPDLEGFFPHENRLWGWSGKTIYASKWGDPRNFNVFDGLESDSWSLTLEGHGEITGGISYQGYPTFFTETAVFRIYGDRPSQYRLMHCGHIGVQKGSADSLAIAGETLYYLSPQGMASFSGGYPQNIHAPFGELRFCDARAASDGIRYLVNMQTVPRTGGRQTYVYDTRWNAWFRYDGSEYTAMTADDGIYMMTPTQILRDGNAIVPTWGKFASETEVPSEVEFNDFTGNYWTAGRGYGNPSRKGTSKLLLRMSIGENTSVKVYICFDQGTWQEVATLNGPTNGEAKMKSYCLPIIPKRSDNYRIRISCQDGGDWTLHSLVREEYSGSDIH